MSSGGTWVPGERLTRGGAPPPTPPADAPRIGVLALQGDVLEHLRALQAAGARAVRVRRPRDLEGLDGLVIPGGESTTIGRLLDLAELSGLVRDRVEEGLPVFGTCAGLILLSDRLVQERPQTVLGGLDVGTRRNAFGRQIHSFEAELDVAGLEGGPFHAVFIRAPWVEESGPEVEVLAQIDGRPVMVRQGNILGAAFHPELTRDTRLHRLFVDMVEVERSRRSRGAG